MGWFDENNLSQYDCWHDFACVLVFLTYFVDQSIIFLSIRLFLLNCGTRWFIFVASVVFIISHCITDEPIGSTALFFLREIDVWSFSGKIALDLELMALSLILHTCRPETKDELRDDESSPGSISVSSLSVYDV